MKGSGHALFRNRALFLVVASSAFCLAGPIARAGRPTHPMVLAFGRVALAAIFLGAGDVAGLFSAFRRATARQRAAVAAAGALLAAHFSLFLWGLDTTSFPAAISLISLEPLSVILWAWVLHRIHPTRLELIGVLAATLGAAIVGRGAGAGEHRLLGDVLVLIAVSIYGLYVAVARTMRDAFDPRHYAALVYTMAALALALALPLLTRFAAFSTLVPQLGRGALAVLGLALFPTLIGHTLVQTGARTMPPAVVALVSPGETLGGILIGAALLRAVPSLWEAAGAAVIVAGTIVAIVGGNPSAQARSPAQ